MNATLTVENTKVKLGLATLQQVSQGLWCLGEEMGQTEYALGLGG